MNVVRVLAAALFAACFAAASISPALAADSVATLRHFLANSQTLEGDFSQTIFSARGRTPEVSSGSVMISRPGKFRWQVNKPYQQTLVGDGEKVWLYDPELAQVTVRRVADALGGTPAALLAGDASREAESAFEFRDGGKRDGLSWVDAVPTASDSSFAKVRFGFSGQALKTMELQDQFGQTTVITFARLKTNAPIPASQFRFKVPDGVDVIGE